MDATAAVENPAGSPSEVPNDPGYVVASQRPYYSNLLFPVTRKLYLRRSPPEPRRDLIHEFCTLEMVRQAAGCCCCGDAKV